MCRSNSVHASSTFFCDSCLGEFYDFARVSASIYDYCKKCAPLHTEECNDCCCATLHADMSDNVAGVCIGCVDDDYTECERCYDYVPSDDTRNVACGDSSRYDETWCTDCADRLATYCDDCNELTSDDEIHSLNGSHRSHICVSCYQEYYFCCDSCGSERHNDNYGGEGNCDECYSDNDEQLEGYGSETWQDLKKHGKQSDWLGIEIELESKDRSEFVENVEYLRQFSDYVALEKDGSLSEYGIESQTTRADIEYHRGQLTSLYSGIMSRFKAESHCGIHISIDGDTLKLWEKVKIWSFVNSPNNSGFVDHIARRPANCYCSRYTKYSVGKNARGAVNMQNYNRLEIRIFRSTVRLERIMEYLEFCDCLRAYVRSGASWSSLGWYDLFSFALKNVKKYPCLVERFLEYSGK